MNFGSKASMVEVLVLLLVRQLRVEHIGNIKSSLVLESFYLSSSSGFFVMSFLSEVGCLRRGAIC